jgi:hypothetical protein
MSCHFLNYGVGTEKRKAVGIEDLDKEDTLDQEWLPAGAEHSESMQGKQQEPVKTSSKTDVGWPRRRATSGPLCQRSTSACWRGQKPRSLPCWPDSRSAACSLSAHSCLRWIPVCVRKIRTWAWASCCTTHAQYTPTPLLNQALLELKERASEQVDQLN